ncbi:Chlorophyllase [Klebsormidium nitens]|uniref:Chlorophyllase n=1 Tax=Klebsormidium nitens TaxID=105231 RepID=A0A1Y1HUE6_KLENI|nr:Chlorophyllase [Klebsormidium nitens]|eukprot:GAQ82244.1 Chlorophyllase [Klebsormidium nitens]
MAIQVQTQLTPVLDPQKQNITLRVAAPIEEGTYPLVVFQHGTSLFTGWYSTLLNYTASQGYIVIAPQMYTSLFPSGCTLCVPTTDAFVEIQNAADVFKWVTDGAPLVLPANVAINFSSVALAGHSRGGKVAAGLAENMLATDVSFQAYVGLDPVDGGPYATAPSLPPTSNCSAPHSTFLNAPALLYGSGLGARSIFPGAPACVPPAVSYAHYFGCYGNQTYELVATDYGHMDLLDDNLSGCCQHPLNCAAAALCAGASAGFSRGLLRTYLGQLVVAFLDSALKGQSGAFEEFFENWKKAPIALKDVQAYPPSLERASS